MRRWFLDGARDADPGEIILGFDGLHLSSSGGGEGLGRETLDVSH